MSWFKIEVIFVLLFYAGLIFILLHGRNRLSKKNKKIKAENNLNDLVVIIPFRNEEAFLPKLIKSIEALTEIPKEFIFVNDHSEDNSFEPIIRLSVPHRILHLVENERGKKKAIEMGVKATNSKYILTWDADLTIAKNYFNNLKRLDWKEMNVLSVKMMGSNLVGGFFAMDYQLQSQANVALAGFYRPITASGANLLFERGLFLELLKDRSDQSILSGDDQFLLAACRKKNKNVHVYNGTDVEVVTEAPKTIQKGMAQRWRWLNKSGKVQDHFATVFGLIVFIIQMSYYSFAVYQTFIGDWGAAIVLVLIKGELDAFLCTYKFQDQFNTLQVFLYELIYPFYMLALILGYFLAKPKWKNRSLTNE